MNAETFRKTLELSKEIKKNLESSKPSRTNYPASPQEALERAKPLIQALHRGRAKLANKNLTPKL